MATLTVDIAADVARSWPCLNMDSSVSAVLWWPLVGLTWSRQPRGPAFERDYLPHLPGRAIGRVGQG